MGDAGFFGNEEKEGEWEQVRGGCWVYCKELESIWREKDVGGHRLLVRRSSCILGSFGLCSFFATVLKSHRALKQTTNINVYNLSSHYPKHVDFP